MFIRILTYIVLFVAIVILAAYLFQNKKNGEGSDKKVRYELVQNWPRLANFSLGQPTGIAVDNNNNLIVFHRAGTEWPLIGKMPSQKISANTILFFDAFTGELKHSWGGNLFIMPHGLSIDNANNIWVTDVALHQVFKFDSAGKLLMKIGEEEIPGNDSAHFNRPTDVAVLPDGSFYVSDGYENSRVIKFSSDGKYLFEWGKAGNNPGEFDIPHGIDADDNGNVYVADRENCRIQVFDSAGKFLFQRSDQSFANINAVLYDKSERKIIAVDDLSFMKLRHRGSDVLIIDSSANISHRFGRSGSYHEAVSWFHDVAIDKQGNIYAADILKNKLRKFRRIEVAE